MPAATKSGAASISKPDGGFDACEALPGGHRQRWAWRCRAPAAGDASLEYAVKAAYLPKFVPFINWPEAAFASPAAPVNICVLGADPFGGKLDQEAAALKAGERPVAVRHLAEPDPQASCQMLFLGAGADPAAGGRYAGCHEGQAGGDRDRFRPATRMA